MSHNPNHPDTGTRPHATPGSAAATPPTTAPRPTSGRENSGLMYFFIGAAVLALLIVLGFNMLGPEGASRSGVGDGPAQAHGPTIGGPTPGADRERSSISGNAAGTGSTGSDSGGNNDASSNAAGGGGTNNGAVTSTTTAAPQTADSPTPAGRDGVGAPMGAAPQAGQSGPGGIPQGTTGRGGPADGSPAPTGVSPDAPAALPASPASR